MTDAKSENVKSEFEEALLTQHQLWYRSHREEKCAKVRAYYQSHRDEILIKMRERQRERYKNDAEYRRKMQEVNVNARKNAMIKARALLGNRCFICEKLGLKSPKQMINQSTLRFHERNGAKHLRDAYLYLRQPERFVLLCFLTMMLFIFVKTS